ncbi:MAG TPA: heme ABC transporter permease [Parvularculaceae bacterium]|nr:heme ABC transporter permease [Parvularculaceae bacterium]
MITELANPERFERFAKPIWYAACALTVVLLALGLYYGLFNSPADYQQGDTVRIMYVHVPAAMMSMACYAAIVISSILGFVWKHPLADVAARTTAPIGAVFTALALATGSLWGKPMWGAWWVWDARLTSELILFFIYLGYIAIWEAVDDKTRAARLAAIVAIVGFVNIPIIHFSVNWWHSLHQGESIFTKDGPKIDGSMLIPLFLMIGGYMALYAALLIPAMKNELTARRLSRLERLGGGVSGVRPE